MSALGGEKSATAAGPWGGSSGSQWDDGVYSGVRQIVLRYGKGIDSIQIEYDKQGSQVGAKKHGGCEGYKTEKVKLNYPEEYLASIHGYYGNLYNGGPLCVRSLTFQSNLKKYGPYGVEQGTYFSSPTNDNQIIGFYGRSGSYLDSIGAHLKPIIKNNTSAKSLVHSPNLLATGTERFNYSVIQGRIRNNNDLVNVIKQKENHLISSPTAFSKESSATTFSKQSSPTTSSKQSSSSYESESSSDDEKKEKIQALPPSKEKECPSGGRKGLSIDATSVHVVEEKVILATRPPSKTLVNGDRVAFNAKNYLRPTKDAKHVMNDSSSITLSKQRSPSFESDNSSDDEKKEKV